MNELQEIQEKKDLEQRNMETAEALFTLINAHTPSGQYVNTMSLSLKQVGFRQEVSLEMTFETVRPGDKDGDKVNLTPELHELMTPLISQIMQNSMLMHEPFISCHIEVNKSGDLVIKYNQPGSPVKGT